MTSVSMTPEMLTEIDDAVEKHPSIDSRAQYIRHAIRECPGTPLDAPQKSLLDELDVEPPETGAA